MELTKIQEAFLADLRDSNHLVIPMNKLQLKYAYIEPNKAKIKREITALVDTGRISREKITITRNGRFMSSTIYKLLIPYTEIELEMMESESHYEIMMANYIQDET